MRAVRSALQSSQLRAALRPPPGRPPPHLPPLPAQICQPVDQWAAEASAAAERASPGPTGTKQASLVMLIGSLRGDALAAGPWVGRVLAGLDGGPAGFRSWMQGRALLAAGQLGDSAAADRLEAELVGSLERDAAGPGEQSAMTLWGHAYLLMHSCARPEPYSMADWLPRLHAVWAGMEAAAGTLGAREQSDRMWSNALGLCSLSMAANSSTAREHQDELLTASLAELVEDGSGLLCLDRAWAGSGKHELEIAHVPKVSIERALEMVPPDDFRCWAAGLVQLALAQAPGRVHGTVPAGVPVDEVVLDALERATDPADKALGVLNYCRAVQMAQAVPY